MKHILLLALLVSGCDCPRPAPEEGDIYRHVERVLMHQPWSYSILVRDGKELKTITLNTNRAWNGSYNYEDAKIITDVPANEDMWVKYWESADENRYRNIGHLDIHIHNAREINGAGWTSGGKHPTSGQTQVVE